MNLGIAGLGVMGANHYNVAQSLNDIHGIVLCDSDNNKDFNHQCYLDFNDMLDSTKLDALIIATPTFLHKDMATKALERGIHILIEKPIAKDTKESDLIIEARDKNRGIKAVVGHIERFNPVVDALKAAISDKKILEINATRLSPLPFRITDVGILEDLSVHDIDLIRYISDSEFKEFNISSSRSKHPSQEDSVNIVFSTEKEIKGSIKNSWLYPYKKRELEVVCEESVFIADLISQELQEFIFDGGNSYIQKRVFVKKGDPLKRELKSFIKYLNCDDMDKFASLEDGKKTLELIGSK